MTLSLSNRALALTLTGALACSAGLAGCGEATSTKDASGTATTDNAPSDTEAVDSSRSVPRGVPTAAVGSPGGVPGQNTPPAVALIPPETVLMTVDGVDVTQAGFDRVLNVYLRGQASTMPPAHLASARAQLRSQIEERLVIEVLIEKAVIAEGVAPSDAEVAAEWKKIEASLPADTTIEQQLASQGYDRAKADKEIRQFLGQKKLDAKIGGEEPVSDKAARDYYDENLASFETPETLKARHILLMTKGATPEVKAAKEKQINEIRANLIANEGKDFERIASEVSECPSKSDGGSLGDMRRGQMVPPFEKMAFSLSVGEISPIVETVFGYHIIKLDKKTVAGTKTYDEVAPSIKMRLASEAQQKRISAYREKLRAAATVVRPDDGAKSEGDASSSQSEAPAESSPSK